MGRFFNTSVYQETVVLFCVLQQKKINTKIWNCQVMVLVTLQLPLTIIKNVFFGNFEFNVIKVSWAALILKVCLHPSLSLSECLYFEMFHSHSVLWSSITARLIETALSFQVATVTVDYMSWSASEKVGQIKAPRGWPLTCVLTLLFHRHPVVPFKFISWFLQCCAAFTSVLLEFVSYCFMSLFLVFVVFQMVQKPQ